MLRLELNSFRSRIARRLFLVFAACAIVPVLATGLLALYELTRLSQQSIADRLSDFSANYGLSLIGRLAEANDSLRAFAQSPEAPAEIARRARTSGLFLDVYVADAQQAAPPASQLSVPWPSAAQQRFLAQGQPVLTWDNAKGATPRIFIFRAVTGQPVWLVARLDPVRLWGPPEDLPQRIDIAVIADNGQLLHASQLPKPFISALQRAVTDSNALGTRGESKPWQSPDARWQINRWRAFLHAAFGSPSWVVIATERAPSVIGDSAQLKVLFPGLLGASALLALLLSVWQIRRYLNPLENLLEGTRRLARREFHTGVTESADDEFGELARSFNTMASSLSRQFNALETVADVDRLLLQSPDLEQVLDSLLPRLASVMGCRTVSVLLVDRDASDQGRIYDFADQSAAAVPVRRITTEFAKLQAALATQPCLRMEAASASRPAFLEPLIAVGAAHFELWPLREGSDLAGLLCLGFSQDAAAVDDLASNARGFADRLSVVLANVAYGQRLYRQAHYDGLTELPNRQLFRDRLARHLESAIDGQRGALLYIDLDHFKRVNDTAGHGAGDELLKIVAQRIGETVKTHDTLARLGGDEFAVVLAGVSDVQTANAVADRVIAAIARPISIGVREYHVSASIGITLFPTDGQSTEELLKNGDLAMYRAKERGRGRAVYYKPEMQTQMQAHTAIVASLQRAVAERQFELYYQPIVDMRTGVLLGAEALMRWTGRDGMNRGPAEFIPIAEETGLIVEMGRWALDEACRQIASWHAWGLVIPYVSVNVSANQLREEETFLSVVTELLRRHGVAAASLQIEIVERVITEGAVAERVLRELSALGIKLALDDFGTGYSSLSYLRTFPIDSVKIDRSFIMDIPQNKDACSLVETIIAMGHALKKSVIAEGVETASQQAFLRDRACDGAQGYLFAKPMSAAQFTTTLAARDEQVPKRAIG